MKKDFGQTLSPASLFWCVFKNLDRHIHKVSFLHAMYATLLVPKAPCVLNWVRSLKKKYLHKKKDLTKIKNAIWKSETRSFQQCMGCLSKFLSEHNKKWSESFMGQTPLFEVLTNIEYVCPPIGPLNHAHHGANSAALLPGCMRNRMPCVCHSGVGGRLIWNQLSGGQLISTQSIPPRIGLRF